MKNKELNQGEWFISSEHEINKFKHGIKTFFLFIALPVLMMQLILAYIFLPIIFKNDFAILSTTIDLAFSKFPNSMIKNFDIFSESMIYISKLYLLFLVGTSPLYFFAGYIFFKRIKNTTKDLLSEKYLEGSKFVSKLEILKSYCGKKKITINKNETEKEIETKLINEFNFMPAGIPLLKSSECAHVLIPGSSRKGKSQMFRDVIFKAKDMSKNFNARGLITDEKGEWLSKTFDKDNGDLLFNPADERSINWNIFNDIDSIIDIENFTKWLIPAGQNGADFWIASAREILKNIFLYLYITDKKSNAEMKKLLNKGADEIAELLSDKLSDRASEFLKKEDSYRTFMTYMEFIEYTQDGDFSVKKWVKESKQGFIYITINNKTKNLLKPILTLFVNVVGSEILALKDNLTSENRIYLFLEEFTSLSKLPILLDLLKLAGSKGCSVWLIFQDFSHITKIYSKDDMLSIINNCSSTICFGLNDPESAEFFSKKFGEVTYSEYSLNHSMGIAENKDGLSMNEQKKTKRLITASDLVNFEKLNCYVKLDDAGGVCQRQLPIKIDNAIAEPFIENSNITNYIENFVARKNIVIPDEKSLNEENEIEKDEENEIDESIEKKANEQATKENQNKIMIAQLMEGL